MKQAQQVEAEAGRLDEAQRWIVAALVVATPLVISPAGKDLFRLPKEMVLRAGWIVLVALLLSAVIRRRANLSLEALRSPVVFLPAAAVAWTAIATLTSSNRQISTGSLAFVAGAAVFFLASIEFAKRAPLKAAALVLIPASVNSLVAAAQEWTEWRPIALEDLAFDRHLMTTGLMGNPNDVGTLLMGPILLAWAGAIVTRGRPRALFAAASVVLIAGLLASRTLTAILATAAGILVMSAVVSWKRAVAGALVLAMAGFLLVSFYPPLAERSRQMRSLIERGDYDAVLTNRLTSFYAAAEMAREHPLTGIGPGTFGWHYFDYRLLVESKKPGLGESRRGAEWNYNFGEVHNDHLEIAAEAGLPAWILYIAALGLLASASLRRGDVPAGERAQIARLLALPLAAAFFVLTLAQFPLQLAATVTTYLFLASLCLAWRFADEE